LNDTFTYLGPNFFCTNQDIQYDNLFEALKNIERISYKSSNGSDYDNLGQLKLLVPKSLRKYLIPSNRENFLAQLAIYNAQEKEGNSNGSGSSKIIEIRKAENPTTTLSQDNIEIKDESLSPVKQRVLELSPTASVSVKKFLSSFVKDGIIKDSKFEITNQNLTTLYHVYCIFGRNKAMRGMSGSSVDIYSASIKKSTDLVGNINDVTIQIKAGLSSNDRQNLLNLLTPDYKKLFLEKYPVTESPFKNNEPPPY
jgi:hypothetical protein